MSMEYYCGLKSQRAADQIKQRNRVLKSYFSLDPMLWLQDRVHKWLVEYLYHRSTIESSLSNTHTYTHTHRATRSHNKTDKKAGWSNHFLICAENHACGACAVVSFSSRLKPFPIFFLFQNWFWFILRQNQARVCVYILFHVNLSKYLLINTYVHAEALSCLCTFSSQWHALHLHVNSPTVCKNVFLKLYCIVFLKLSLTRVNFWAGTSRGNQREDFLYRSCYFSFQQPVSFLPPLSFKKIYSSVNFQWCVY